MKPDSDPNPHCLSCINNNGYCQGVYRWDKVRKAHTRSCSDYYPRWWMRVALWWARRFQ